MAALFLSNSLHKPVESNYNILHKIGEGRYGEIFLVEHKFTAKKFAVKKISSDKSIGFEHIILRKCNHMNIVRYEECYHTQKFEIVMHYAGNVNLLQYIYKSDIEENETRSIMIQLVSAVDYIHTLGIVHRDIKLENIMIVGNIPIIIDFGFATFWNENSKIEKYCGSIHYSSPEIIAGTPYFGPEVDIWSLCVVLYTMTHFCFPFYGKTEDEIFAKILSGRTSFDKNISHSLRSLMFTIFSFPISRQNIKYFQSSEWIRGLYDISVIKRLDIGNISNKMSKASTQEYITQKIPLKTIPHDTSSEIVHKTNTLDLTETPNPKNDIVENKNIENIDTTRTSENSRSFKKKFSRIFSKKKS